MEPGAELASGQVSEGASSPLRRLPARRLLGLLSLRTEFLVLGLLFVAVATSVVLYEHSSSNNSTRQMAAKQAAAAAQVAALQVGVSITNIDQTVAQLASSRTVAATIRNPTDCNLTFNTVARSVGHLDLLRPNGAVVCSSLSLAHGRAFMGYVGQAWVHRALTTPSLTAPVYDARLHSMVIRIVIPAPHGSGIVEASVELAPIAGALATTYSDGNPDEFLLTNGAGKVLSRSIDPAASVGRSLAGTRFGLPHGPLPTHGLDGTSRLYGEAAVPALGWTLFVGENAHDALAGAAALFRHELEIVVVGLALTLATLTLVYRQLARPIARLASSVRANSTAAARVPIEIAGPGEVRALAQDVDGLIEAVNAELERREHAEARVRDLAAIVESSSDAIQSESLAGTITSWNAAAEHLYGYSEAEAVGMPSEMLIPADRRDEHGALMRTVRVGARAGASETVRLRKGSEPIDVALSISAVRDASGAITGLSTSARDITELKRAREAVRRSEETYRLLFERHPRPMWLFDTDTLRFLRVNDAAIESYGYSQAEFRAMTVEDIRPAEERDAARRAAAAAPGGPLAPTVWRHVKKDGTLIDVEVSANTVEFEGRPVRLVLAQDVSERLRLEEHVRQAQKMDAVGNLAGGIAHDFNNTLTVIRATVDLLLPTVEDDQTRERIRQIELAAEHATTLTRQLLAFGRVQVLRPEPIDLNLVVEESLDLAGRLLGDHIAVRRTLESPLPPVLADRGQLQQVILNLAINARDAMPDGGTLTVHTRRIQLDERYTAAHPDLHPGRYLLIEIADTGVGMDTELQRRIFDPFFTTKNEGTGLGLATVYGIVKQSGGHISVYSEPGHGTTFKIYLPPSAAPSEPVAAARPSADTPLGGDETILLVEDAELLRPLTAEVLTNYGYTVLSTANGEAALAAATAHPGRIDLLLTDVVMPGINGRELAERLLRARPGLRVIFTSGYPSDSVVRHGIATADVAFIQKPYLASDLLAEIRTVLDS